MKERSRELKSASDRVEGESAVLAKIAELSEADRSLAGQLHALIRASAPALVPRLWYGMPAYALEGKDGKVVCFFQSADKFKTRYATLGFSDVARLDEGDLWPTAFALTAWTESTEASILALLTRAVGLKSPSA